MIPLMVAEGFIICFEAAEECTDMRQHFMEECDYTLDEFQEIRDYEWFCANVSAWQDGVLLAETYLGCCCYETASEFYTTYRDDYFADMVEAVLVTARRRLSSD